MKLKLNLKAKHIGEFFNVPAERGIELQKMAEGLVKSDSFKVAISEMAEVTNSIEELLYVTFGLGINRGLSEQRTGKLLDALSNLKATVNDE